MNKNIKLSNGDSFNGVLNQNGTSFQSGVYNFRNGDFYSGDYLYGSKHGFGVYNYVSTG